MLSGPVGAAAHRDATRWLSLWHKANYRIKIVAQAIEIQHMRAIAERALRRSDAWERDSNWSWRAIAEGSEMPTPQAFLAHRKVIPSAFYDGPTRRIGVIITRFRLIGLVFIDRS